MQSLIKIISRVLFPKSAVFLFWRGEGNMNSLRLVNSKNIFAQKSFITFLAFLSLILLSILLLLNYSANLFNQNSPGTVIDVLGSTLTIQDQTQLQSQNDLAAAGVNLSGYESAVLNLINTVRAGNGLGALQPNQSLTDIARTRSNDMLSRDYFSHYTPEGKTFANIMKECGITYSATGENLAQSKPADIGSPEAFLNAWMNSPTHAANILKNRYGIIGIGMIENGGRRIVTTIFRNP
jgi:uncharacterized protein YkwD